ncbi:hypothetical protein Micbo1qcDRAFT_183248 [Microdochium bolleyi]|uniref:Zn(2)-C6 fungal-type domain-containing protein n=1 Tax=Microdochium bolleyi TaxID=196109 RepID=A0A136J8X3_9PEZI|nr:hypothetical protein Micbo1qcDRAFT_183248 [Microdochium bolleyi]
MDSPASLGSDPGARRPRNLQACDACRSRKVKDDRCRGCRHADVSCTQNTPRRTRGPGKRLWMQQQQQVHNAQTPPVADPYLLSSPSPLEHATSPSVIRASRPTVQHPSPAIVPTADSEFHGLCSRALILSILTDWASHHFLHRLLSREDERNPVFCALVISTVAVTVTTLRRLSFQNYPHVTVHQCVAAIDRENMLQPRTYTVDWCISCYNIASSFHALDGQAELRQYQGIKDAITGVQWLLFCDPARDGMALHDREVLRRLYWLMTMWQLAAELRGEVHMSFLPSRSLSLQLDETRPRAVPDKDLAAPCPDLDVSALDAAAASIWLRDEDEYVTGLNSLIDVMMTWEHVKIDMTHRPAEKTLRSGMARMQNVMDTLAPELRWRGGLTRFPLPSHGHEAQTVNILITSLYVRSNLLQHLGPVPGISHSSIVSDVLGILEHMPPGILEANGFSLVKKIRDMGAAYLQELRVAGDSPFPVVDDTAQQTVNTLLARLEKLDFRGAQGHE